MATRTVMLTVAELRECVAERALDEVSGMHDAYDESIEFVTTADGVAALVVFKDKGEARPASMPPVTCPK